MSGLEELNTSERQLPEELKEFKIFMGEYRLNEALECLLAIVRSANKYIDEQKPWELVKTNPGKFDSVMQNLVWHLRVIAKHLQLFLPSTSEKIEMALKAGTVEPLFQRIK
jgi:methionyl-tRNA synthetase